jgi:glutamate carboxypeptidase
MDNYRQYFEAHLDELLATLGTCVQIESPSTDKKAADKLGEWLAEQLEVVGARVEFVQQEDYGKHVVGRWGSGEQHILILGHYDTVWPVGEVESRPFRIEGNKAYGPGVFDMKVGDVQVLYALRCLNELGVDCNNRVTVLYNSDEEVGSPTSRPIIERLAKEADYVFVLEPSVPPEGALKTFRKGVGMFRVAVEGKASHAGADHENGVSAVEELARQILDLQAMTDYDRGTTVNVGVVQGGSRSNVVAASAEAEVDLRVTNMEEADRMEHAILNLRSYNPKAGLTIEGGINRPPMERTERIVKLFRNAQRFAEELGFEVTEAGTGGGSDGNFTAAMGVPTLDGLGGVGGGGHAENEHVIISEIPKRTALLAKLIAEL